MNLRRCLLGSCVLAVCLTGCGKHLCNKRGCAPAPACPPAGALPPVGQPFIGSPGNIPPANIPPANIPPGAGPDRTNFFVPRSTPEILLPDGTPRAKVLTPAPPGQGPATLLRPEFLAPSSPVVTEDSTKPPAKAGSPTPEPPPASTFPPPPAGGPSLPVGIADFAQVKPDVTAGLKPDLDGLGWLKQNSYKMVLSIRKPSESDAADRRLVERHGMRFQSIAVSPESLGGQIVDEFNRIVNDTGGRPVFVYDRDGTLAGVMWYLYFRTSEGLSHDEARVRAGRLGLKENGGPEQTAMWLAVQKYLEPLMK